MFATMHHNRSAPFTGHAAERPHMTELKNASALRADRQMRRERWMAVGVLALFAALMVAMIVLAAMFGSYSGTGYNGYDFWLMP